jgi:hypothetical protein
MHADWEVFGDDGESQPDSFWNFADARDYSSSALPIPILPVDRRLDPVIPDKSLHFSQKNRVKKGFGRDSFADPRDNYPFTEGWTYRVLKQALGHAPNASTVFQLCRALRARCPELPCANRWVWRRLAVAYAWLDQNSALIPMDQLDACLSLLQAGERS